MSHHYVQFAKDNTIRVAHFTKYLFPVSSSLWTALLLLLINKFTFRQVGITDNKKITSVSVYYIVTFF